MKITVAGVGYVGLSLAVLLAQNHEVTAITTTPAKADKLNQFFSPIQDDEIERFFEEARKGERKLQLTTTTDKAAAYGSAELVIIATPTNYDDVNHFFDTSAVEDAIEQTLKVNPLDLVRASGYSHICHAILIHSHCFLYFSTLALIMT